MISLDQGIENNKAEIEIKLHEVEENGSRLRNHRDNLEKRRLEVNKSIEEAKSEVERVAEHCISMICEHKTNVTERLIARKANFEDAVLAQMASLDDKKSPIYTAETFWHGSDEKSTRTKKLGLARIDSVV